MLNRGDNRRRKFTVEMWHRWQQARAPDARTEVLRAGIHELRQALEQRETMITNVYHTTPDGTRWRIVQAESTQAALEEIAAARVTGSLGSTRSVVENGVERVIAKVQRVLGT